MFILILKLIKGTLHPMLLIRSRGHDLSKKTT